jgi:hypothetical protein
MCSNFCGQQMGERTGAMGTGKVGDQVVAIRDVDERCLAGGDTTLRSFRDRRLRRRLRRALGGAVEIDIAFTASTTPRPRASKRVAVVVDSGGALSVCCRSMWPRAIVVKRIGSDDQIGAIYVSPGDAYIDIAGVRHWVLNPWLYELSRLQRKRMAAEGSGRHLEEPCAGDAAATGSRLIGA